MPRLLPELDDPQLSLVKSRAEQQFYRACRNQLPADWLVLFSTRWVGCTPSGRRHDGEADFVILVPGMGLLVVEVKGGGVVFEPVTGSWFSTDATGTRHAIKDPFRQALGEKYAIRDLLERDSEWRNTHRGRLCIGHSVFLADVGNLNGVVSPESPREILGGREQLTDITSWVRSVLAYWSGRDDNSTPLSVASIRTAESILHGRLEARPLLSARIDAEETVRIRLTQQQSRVLRALGTRQRAAISGGAGTGKTLLAIEQARRLAAEGKETLLLCFNRLLSDFMKLTCADVTSVHAMTFHQLCDWKVAVAKARTGRDFLAEAKLASPSRGPQDLWDMQMPLALAMSCEVLVERYDAIIIDEGQDFRDEYWLPIEWLLRDQAQSHLLVFYDQNQSLYANAATFPVKDPPFVLSVNCRNTKAIHEIAYRYFQGDPTDPADENPGVAPDAIHAPSIAAQATALHSAIVRLLTRDSVRPFQLAVLVCGEPKADYYAALKGLPLPARGVWEFEGSAVSGNLRVDTVRRFKGLEADLVFLWGVDRIPSSEVRELLYVGTSRAKSHLTIVGTREACERVQRGGPS